MDYKTDLKIDETALDVEWLNQPSLLAKYTKIAAQARLDMDTAKDYLDYKKAELDKNIRKNPDKYGVEKVTEGAIASAIVLDDEYKEAQEELNNCRYEYDMVRGMVEAFEQRKSALENLVKLFNSNYFAGPTVPRDLSQKALDFERGKELNKSIATKMKRKHG